MQVAKRFVPLPVKKALVQSSSYYKARYAWARRQVAAPSRANTTTELTVKGLTNALPNEGPIPLKQDYTSAQSVIESFPDAARRKQDIAGFDGFAADDAIFDPATQQAEMWSYAPLAAYI
ncbi:MAG TPA: hypothetical protein VMP08_23660, partial [Anaerolineae bacterium]|nr:hypothetical protein [Anaerolineae bacterium]